MTVEELTKLLEKLDPKAKVYLAQDEEGNNFHNLVEVDETTKSVVLWPDTSFEDPLAE